MAEGSPSQELKDALAAFDFPLARGIAASLPDDDKATVTDQIADAEEQASDQADQLAGRIQSLARADHYEALLALADDPTTDQLLGLLSDEIKRGAELHLDGARRRQERFQAAALKHMAGAADALVLLDTTRARSELDKIDKRWLSDEQRDDLTLLAKQTEEAAAERRELDATTAEVLRDHHPSQATRRTGQASRAEKAPGRRGCGTTSLLVVGLVGTVATLLRAR